MDLRFLSPNMRGAILELSYGPLKADETARTIHWVGNRPDSVSYPAHTLTALKKHGIVDIVSDETNHTATLTKKGEMILYAINKAANKQKPKPRNDRLGISENMRMALREIKEYTYHDFNVGRFHVWVKEESIQEISYITASALIRRELIEVVEKDGQNVLALTEKGRSFVAYMEENNYV